jgi:hypothetical protein
MDGSMNDSKTVIAEGRMPFAGTFLKNTEGDIVFQADGEHGEIYDVRLYLAADTASIVVLPRKSR